MRSDRLGDTLLPKWIALPVFCSDPLSSVAYATEEILLVLALGGLALLGLTWWVAAGIVVLLVVVIASYRQTCHAYPTGGGAYAVSRANLGRSAALVAASALLVDYVLTVAVSVAAGVANIVSAFPRMAPATVPLNIALVTLLALMNLRGVKESGRAFAIPTFAVIAKVHIAADPGQLVGFPAGAEQRTVIAQLGRAVFGGNSPLFYGLQVFTAAILILAANTAFTGFPVLASILSADDYLP